MLQDGIDIEDTVGEARKAVPASDFHPVLHVYPYYMALASGRHNTRSDWLRARTEWSLCSRNAHWLIKDYPN